MIGGPFLPFLTTVAVNAIPALGWFTGQWSSGTTLVIYWGENVLTSFFVAARIALHQRVNPRRGHFRYQARQGTKNSVGAPFLPGYLQMSLIFSGAHGFFLAALFLLLTHNGQGAQLAINWREVAVGSGAVCFFLAVDFLVDLRGLRDRPFFWVEQLADRHLGRVIIIHLTLIFGLVGAAITGATKAFFAVFVGLKTLNDLAGVLPQWEPERPPPWLSRLMNRVPSAHPGKTFEEFWVEDKAGEISRRRANERPFAAD